MEGDVDLDRVASEFSEQHDPVELGEEVEVEGSSGTAFDGPFSKAPPCEWPGSPLDEGEVLACW